MQTGLSKKLFSMLLAATLVVSAATGTAFGKFANRMLAGEALNLTIVAPIPDVEITYDANGGNSAPEKEIAKKGQSHKLTAEVPTWDSNHKFEGWALDRSGPAKYQPEGEITVEGDTTLFAIWSEVGAGTSSTGSDPAAKPASVEKDEPVIQIQGDPVPEAESPEEVLPDEPAPAEPAETTPEPEEEPAEPEEEEKEETTPEKTEEKEEPAEQEAERSCEEQEPSDVAVGEENNGEH